MTWALLMEKAKILADLQGGLARSPAERLPDGEIILCAASCIAKAALIAMGDRAEAARFNERACSESKDNYVPAIFRKCRLDIDALAIMSKNDELAGPERLQWFKSMG